MNKWIAFFPHGFFSLLFSYRYTKLTQFLFAIWYGFFFGEIEQFLSLFFWWNNYMEFIFYISLIILIVGCESSEEYIDVNVDKFFRKIDEDILYSTADKYDVTTDVLDKKPGWQTMWTVRYRRTLVYSWGVVIPGHSHKNK